MITSVVKLKENMYKLNDCIIIRHVSCDDNMNISVDYDIDEDMITEAEAEKIVNKFIKDAIESVVEGN